MHACNCNSCWPQILHACLDQQCLDIPFGPIVHHWLPVTGFQRSMDEACSLLFNSASHLALRQRMINLVVDRGSIEPDSIDDSNLNPVADLLLEYGEHGEGLNLLHRFIHIFKEGSDISALVRRLSGAGNVTACLIMIWLMWHVLHSVEPCTSAPGS